MKRSKHLAKGLTLTLCLFLAACGNQAGGDKPQQSSPPTAQQNNSASEKKLKIGITQIIEHASLDASREGFIAALKDNGFEDGKNIEIDYQSAQGDPKYGYRHRPKIRWR